MSDRARRQAAAASVQTTTAWTVGLITFGISCIAAIAAFTARETFKIHLNDLGLKDSKPVSDEEYAAARERAYASV